MTTRGIRRVLRPGGHQILFKIMDIWEVQQILVRHFNTYGEYFDIQEKYTKSAD